jgi:hypothetical protein
VLLEGGIEVIDISLMVLAMMDLHGLLVNVWLERVMSVWQWCEFVFHESLLEFAARGFESRQLEILPVLEASRLSRETGFTNLDLN